MARLAFLADAHVNRAYVSAVRSNGFRMIWLDHEDYDPSIGDSALLDWGRREALVVVTNDSDFVELANSVEHAGVILYHQYGHPPGRFARAIIRIDRYLTPGAFQDHVEWLENWL